MPCSWKMSLLDIEEIAVRFKRGRGPRAPSQAALSCVRLLHGSLQFQEQTDVDGRCVEDNSRTSAPCQIFQELGSPGLFTRWGFREAGLVKMGHLSLDGIRPTKHKASYQHETEPRLEPR